MKDSLTLRTEKAPNPRTFAGAPLGTGLTDAQIAQYRRDGYVVVRHVIATHEVFALRAACDALEDIARDYAHDEFIGATFFALHRDANPFAKGIEQLPPVKGLLRRVTYPYAVNATLDAFRTHPRLLGALRSLLGDDVVQVVNQVNFNPAASGAGWGWHQDYRFRKAGLIDPVNEFVQSLLAIDTCSLYTGGLRIVPRSHELGPLALDTDNENAERHFDASRAITPEMAPGDVILFNPYIIHGSTANLSPSPRRVYINGYARAGIPYGMPVLVAGVADPAARGRMEYEGDRDILPKASKY